MKQYGLILKGKNAQKKAPNPAESFFNVEDEPDEEDWKKKELEARKATQAKLARQAEMEQAEILKNNPDAFEYDEVYDTLKDKDAAFMRQKPTDKSRKSRYIGDLRAAAKLKEREQFQYLDRKIQRERKNEKEQFGDSEKFVTGAYKKHLIDLKRWKEEDEKQLAAEAEMDPTKKGHMMDFYSGLLRGNIALGTSGKSASEDNNKEEVVRPEKVEEKEEKEEKEAEEKKEEKKEEVEKKVEVVQELPEKKVVEKTKRDLDSARERYLARKKARMGQK